MPSRTSLKDAMKMAQMGQKDRRLQMLMRRESTWASHPRRECKWYNYLENLFSVSAKAVHIPALGPTNSTPRHTPNRNSLHSPKDMFEKVQNSTTSNSQNQKTIQI